jgi:hypothetical protein
VTAETGGIVSTALDSAGVQTLLHTAGIEAVQIPRPALDDHPFCKFVRALLRAPGFKLDFNGRAAEAVLTMVSDRLIGPGAFPAELRSLAEEIRQMQAFAQELAGGPQPQVSLRTYFAPGDLVWHVDRVAERRAFRLLWPLGRPAGMRLTSQENIDPDIYAAYMRREHPLLCRLDSEVLRIGAAVESLWAHRPAQLAAMIAGQFPFIRDPRKEWTVEPGAISIHRVETPVQRGSYHRSSWANRAAPGLQIVITASADEA